MQNGTITCYLPYNIVSSSNLVVNVCIVEYRFLARQVNGETWVQKIHFNVEQAQILSYVYIFRGCIVSILQPWQCELTSKSF